MAKKSKGAKNADAGSPLPQFNYKVPGELDTIVPNSKELVDGDPEQVAKDAEEELKTARKRREAEVNDGDVSPYAGMSPPMTQLELDGENTWSGPGGRAEG